MVDPNTIQTKTIHSLVKKIINLSNALPAQAVRLAIQRDKICMVMHGPEGETPWQTLNKRFDALFAEDCRDDQGRLPEIRRGQYGMDLVAKYLEELGPALDEMPREPLAIKLERLTTELEFLAPKAAKSLGARFPIISTTSNPKAAQPETTKEGEKAIEKKKKLVLDTGKLV
ncbi:hypothetical protein HWV62_43656 [Athelia sp. TMB]|nr:hypothetical protein HWV62_43656 [Athelia sp. TMB]